MSRHLKVLETYFKQLFAVLNEILNTLFSVRVRTVLVISLDRLLFSLELSSLFWGGRDQPAFGGVSLSKVFTVCWQTRGDTQLYLAKMMRERQEVRSSSRLLRIADLTSNMSTTIMCRRTKQHIKTAYNRLKKTPCACPDQACYMHYWRKIERVVLTQKCIFKTISITDDRRLDVN